MSVDASDLYSIERKLERVADELRRRNEIEAQKLDQLKQIDKNFSRAEVIGEECGQIRLANREGGFEDAPCVYLDI